MAKLPGTILLSTRSGVEIPNSQDPDLPPESARRLVEQFRRKFPMVHYRREPSGQYNCHGLAFANRRTGIYDPAIVAVVLREDGYRRIRLADVQVGDIAVHYEDGEISHTGMVVGLVEGLGIDVRVARILSKWGQLAEYVHLVTDGPYANHTIEYWTDRS